MTRRAVPRFLDWLRDGGAQLSKLSVQETASGRGVVATASYSAGEASLQCKEVAAAASTANLRRSCCESPTGCS